jgi:Mn2+/Fe2+ NRAMP family transporter
MGVPLELSAKRNSSKKVPSRRPRFSALRQSAVSDPPARGVKLAQLVAVSAPVMAMMMLIGSNPKIMKRFVVTGPLKYIGWVATAVMAVASVGMVVASVLT